MLRISQRVVVMRDHRKIGELVSSDIDVADLVDYIAEHDITESVA